MRRQPAIAAGVGLGWLAALIMGTATGPALGQRQGRKDRSPAPRPVLRMSEGVVCHAIEGYENYEPLAGAALTSDEKLLVYYRPLDYGTALVEGSYQAHFTQDAEIRRRGEKAVLLQKKKLLDYTATSPHPPDLIFLRNTISLKGLKSGEYNLTIILHDEIAKGPPATQIVKFRVVPVEDPQKKTGPRLTRREKSARRARQASQGQPGVADSLLMQMLLEWELSGDDEPID